MAGYATGITVVAAAVNGRIAGLSANSFTSVSLEPPLASVAFDRSSTTWPILRQASRWGVSVLGEGAGGVLRSMRRPAAHRFDGIDVRVTEDGAAFIDGALATLTVEAHREIDAGDHVLTILRVLDLQRDDRQRPLVFFGSAMHRLVDEALD